MINEKYTCYLVSKSSLQSSLLKQSLEKSLDIVILDVSFTELLQSLSSKKSNKNLNYVIIDLNHLQDDYLSKYLILVDEKNLNTKEILINSESVIIIDDLMRLPNLTGLFYESDTMELMSKGMQKMLDGEFWISRDLATSIITVHRKDKYFTSSVIAELTRREEEIMKLLTLGASNSQIAEQLFVSENTVKTHLHNVFKKIKVKSRLQAVMWAKGQQFQRV
ncbi:helix-turn-helix transcriptional regulator [Moritella marina ATCC 15381]|uniref:Helix-turn-helix transcriptional regulator n=1 Tax=Moritella marina ATCC 15381 TaxID=1202962 RepID=A0A5J6WJK3_MORMI|nr:LuxR C-terminal-related transcriptional regulator [Moritella marina]QFI38197.1 helix-turn-helix transcriptional regulator [Moritella marina ATCC 15381]